MKTCPPLAFVRFGNEEEVRFVGACFGAVSWPLRQHAHDLMTSRDLVQMLHAVSWP